MYSREHALLSLVVAVGAVAWLPLDPLLAVPWALAVGVGVDFDHFLLARLVDGDWRAVRRALARPSRVLFDQSALFADSASFPEARLLSHVLLGGVGFTALWPVAPALAALTGATLYVHVLADLVWDVYERRRG
ncbi:MAG: hypothetical protein ABEJ89_07270 [Haloarculaceae archaeon]